MVVLVTKCNGSWLWQFWHSVANVLTQLSGASNDEQDDEVDDNARLGLGCLNLIMIACT